jgi:hypothetical protein
MGSLLATERGLDSSFSGEDDGWIVRGTFPLEESCVALLECSGVGDSEGVEAVVFVGKGSLDDVESSIVEVPDELVFVVGGRRVTVLTVTRFV